MISHTFPFFAGQLTDKTFGSSLVLSPVPVHTNIAPLESHDVLIEKPTVILKWVVQAA